MMKYGGLQLGEAWGDNTGRRYADCTVWGTVTLDAKEVCLRKPKIEFRVKYRKKQFIHCNVWEGSPFYDVARRLKMGDWVEVKGTYVKTQYSVRSGEMKERYELNVGFLIPGLAIYDEGALTAHRVMQFKEPDPFESADDRDEADGDVDF